MLGFLGAAHPSILSWRIPTERGAQQAAVHGAAKSQTQLSDEHVTSTSSKSCPSLDCTCLIYKIKVLRPLQQTAQKRGQEELPLTQGQGQRPRVPGCNSPGAAERSYPTPGVGAVAKRSYPTPEVGAVAKRSYPTPEVGAAAKSSYPTPKFGWRPGGATPRPRSRGCAGPRRAERSYSTFKVRRGSQ